VKALRFHNSLPRLVAAKVLGYIWQRAYVSSVAPSRLDDIPQPKFPANDWVRIRTKLAGICGSDVKQVLLKGSTDNPLTALISFPHVLGHEAVGVIEEIGSGVSTQKVGERVVLNPWLSCIPRGIEPPCPSCRIGKFPLCQNFSNGYLSPGIHMGKNVQVPGVFARSFICHESQCFPIPLSVTDEVAVLADPYSVSLHSVLNNPPADDAIVLVYGLGILGLTTLSILRKFFPKNEILVIGRYPHQIEFARTLGADQVLTGSPQELILAIADLVGTVPLSPWKGLPWLLDGVGIVYDTVGSPETVETAIRLIRPHGRLVISGVEAPKRFEWTPLYFKEINIVGSNAFGIEPIQGARKHAYDIFLDLATKGLDLSHLITHRYALDDWQKAFYTCMKKQETGAVKVLFDFEKA